MNMLNKSLFWNDPVQVFPWREKFNFAKSISFYFRLTWQLIYVTWANSTENRWTLSKTELRNFASACLHARERRRKESKMFILYFATTKRSRHHDPTKEKNFVRLKKKKLIMTPHSQPLHVDMMMRDQPESSLRWCRHKKSKHAKMRVTPQGKLEGGEKTKTMLTICKVFKRQREWKHLPSTLLFAHPVGVS